VDSVTLLVFALVYLGMVLGGLPGLAIDRTGVAVLGAIALVATGRVSLERAWNAIDASTVTLLLGLMVVSAQFRLGGFYSAVTRRLASASMSPPRLLLAVILVAAGLSALLANDIVCLAMAPLLVEGCLRRGMNPAPFLLALACAANVGSAATLIGNPQNMLIGQALDVSFAGYLADGLAPAAVGCLAVWGIIARRYRAGWQAPAARACVAARELNRWQTAKGAAVLIGLLIVFLAGGMARDVAALAAAGLLLTSRKLHTREMLALVDWPLLLLFAGLFIVNDALQATGLVASSLDRLAGAGVDVRRPAALFVVTTVLSNVVSNVPAVMLLLPAAEHPQSAAILALSSTLAGNLLLVGSIANIIVVDQARQLNVHIGWREHARVGVPVTLATLAIAAGWLMVRSP